MATEDHHSVYIGDIEILLPPGHHLKEIYQRNQTYDFVPWNIIGELMSANRLDGGLIDVGANVGDSAAHYRRYSSAPILCIEPSKIFCEFLDRNRENIGNLTILNKIVSPAELCGQIRYVSNHAQTGSTTIVDSAAGLLQSSNDSKATTETVTIEEILQIAPNADVFKTDTDGFDAKIVGSVCQALSNQLANFAIVFFEGANAQQLTDNRFVEFVEITERLQDLGFYIILLTNVGIPFCCAGRTHETVRSAFFGLHYGYKTNAAFCHYFDILAVKEQLMGVPTLFTDFAGLQPIFRDFLR